MGSKFVINLLQFPYAPIRDKIAENWFKLLSYQSLNEINGRDALSTEYKMKINFFAKYKPEDIKKTVNDAANWI